MFSTPSILSNRPSIRSSHSTSQRDPPRDLFRRFSGSTSYHHNHKPPFFRSQLLDGHHSPSKQSLARWPLSMFREWDPPPVMFCDADLRFLYAPGGRSYILNIFLKNLTYPIRELVPFTYILLCWGRASLVELDCIRQSSWKYLDKYVKRFYNRALTVAIQ